VISYEVEERLGTRKILSTAYRISISSRFYLRDESEERSVLGNRLGIGSFIAGPDNNTHFLDSAGKDLPDDEAEDGARAPFSIDKSLHGQLPLLLSRRCDDSFSNLHFGTLRIAP
jgi:hypothetical protein